VLSRDAMDWDWDWDWDSAQKVGADSAGVAIATQGGGCRAPRTLGKRACGGKNQSQVQFPKM
jgi:hypothetical protein